jgi:hypothetical protein
VWEENRKMYIRKSGQYILRTVMEYIWGFVKLITNIEIANNEKIFCGSETSRYARSAVVQVGS